MSEKIARIDEHQKRNVSGMMNIREKFARMIAPGLKSETEIRTIVAEEIQRTKMSLPLTANYDLKNEGYRRMSGFDSRLRDLMPMAQDRMFEIAYFMWDNSLMMRRLAVMDKSFIFNGPIKLTADDPDVQEVLDAFQKKNKLARRYPDRAMWLSLLGEQVWPVTVNPYNGAVTLAYEDPSDIVDVLVNPTNIEDHMQLELRGRAGRETRKVNIVRESADINGKAFGRLDGECFFWRINAPPNSPRGRSDFLTLFDWIDGLERYGFNYLERAEFLLNFVWDVTLKGMNADQIRDWLRNNPPPDPGSLRAHNENVTWQAVAPDINAADFKGGFDMGKAIVMGGAGRPSSWFGEGGKAYQTEAEQFGQVPIADLNARSYLHKCLLTNIGNFVIDQAVIHGILSAEKAAAGCTVQMPEVSKNDLMKLTNGVPQLASALTIAQTNKWIMPDEATRLFCFFASYLGYEIDPQEQIDAAAAAPPDDTKDYENDIFTLKARMTDRPSINITTPPVNIVVKIEKGPVKKTIAYTDIDGKPKKAVVTEEDL